MVPAFVFIAVFLVIASLVVLGARAQAKQVALTQRLYETGTPARGLVLQASQYVTTTTAGGRRYERRDLVLDVEMPGQAPFEVRAQPMIPGSLAKSVLPGASLELRIDPANPSELVVVGPAGSFSPAYAGVAQAPGVDASGYPIAALLAPLPGIPGAPGPARKLAPLALVALVVGLGAIISATQKSRSSHEPKTGPKSTAVRRQTPEPAGAAATVCKQAADCCRTAGGTASTCEAFGATITQAEACKASLDGFRKSATARGKTCR